MISNYNKSVGNRLTTKSMKNLSFLRTIGIFSYPKHDCISITYIFNLVQSCAINDEILGLFREIFSQNMNFYIFFIIFQHIFEIIITLSLNIENHN